MTSQAMYYSVPQSTQIIHTSTRAGLLLGLPVQSHYNVQYDPLVTNWCWLPCSGSDQSSEMLIKAVCTRYHRGFLPGSQSSFLLFQGREKERAISFGAKSTNGPLNAALDVLMDNKFPLSSKEKFVFRGSWGCRSHLFTPP